MKPRRSRVAGVLIAAGAAALVVVALIPSGASASRTNAGLVAPEAGAPVPSSVGKGEGKLNLIAWEGYVQPEWTKPFEQQTGCQVNVKYGTTSSDMVSLMANGGGHQYDLVSASGDADLRLIYGGDVRPVNLSLIPAWKELQPFLQSPSFNTIAGKHYGVSFEFGPNVLLYSTKVFKTPPASWSVIYNKQYAGEITVPDDYIQIADAALYLAKTEPKLGITDPYELTQPQFNATVALLKAQHPLIKKYWDLASQEESLFQSGTTVVGAAWPVAVSTLIADKDPVAETIPKEGATGWADSWLLATNAPDPNCAYKWMQYMTTPQVQAEDAVSYGETPGNKLACPLMDKIQKGSCEGLHANAPASYFQSLYFWKTPLATCDNGKSDCVPIQNWVAAWTQVIG